MGKPSSAVNPMVLSILLPAPIAHHGSAASQMSGHDPPFGRLRCRLAQAFDDVLVGQTLGSRSVVRLLVQLLGIREAVGDRRVPAMKGRIEAGNLQELRAASL
jgi:hypothetical protein